MRSGAIQPNNMAKKTTLKNKGAKPMSFKQAMKIAVNTPYRTHKEIDELRKSGKLDELINRTK